MEKLLVKLDREVQRWDQCAGERAVHSLVCYADKDRAEADKREALRFYGRAEQTRDIIQMIQHGLFE